jgi:hypothetical protein
MKKRLSISLSTLIFIVFSAQAVEKASEERLDEVAKQGAHIMPFSLEQTLHVFLKTENGGLQQVIAKDSSDIEQITLIREHLSQISQEFRQGDFSRPAKIHGEDMPGLLELRKAHPDQINIVYEELPNGAEIKYSANYAKLIKAIHEWFDAQLSDHARHATPEHQHHPMHHHHEQQQP